MSKSKPDETDKNRSRSTASGKKPSAPMFNSGEITRKLRQTLGLTQEEFAHLYHVKQSVIAKMEAREDIRLSTLCKMASALGLTVTLHFSSQTEQDSTRLLEVPLHTPPPLADCKKT